jgi:hypothetical protein
MRRNSILIARIVAHLRLRRVCRRSWKEFRLFPSFVSLHPADVGEAEEVEGLRPPQATRPPFCGNEFAEGDQARFVGVEVECKPSEAFLQIVEELGRISLALETNDCIVGITHDDHVARRLAPPPGLDPQIIDIVEVDVRQEGTAHSPNAKGNFCFDRVIALDRSRCVLDLRLKR